MSRLRAFTLLELLVVMVIIGLLAGYVGPRLFSQIGKSETKAAKAQINALKKQLADANLMVEQLKKQVYELEKEKRSAAEEPAKPVAISPTVREWTGANGTSLGEARFDSVRRTGAQRDRRSIPHRLTRQVESKGTARADGDRPKNRRRTAAAPPPRA